MIAPKIEEIVKKNKPADAVEGPVALGNSEGLDAAMEEFAAACDAKDYSGMASAFKNAFLICESEPHSEAGTEE